MTITRPAAARGSDMKPSLISSAAAAPSERWSISRRVMPSGLPCVAIELGVEVGHTVTRS